MTKPAMLLHFKKYIAEQQLVAKTDRLLLGVSGGSDSMVMLELCIKAGYNVAVAHCNFSLRGAESDAEQEFVVQAAHRYGVPIYVQRFDTAAEASQNGESIQMAARRLRYEWFQKILEEPSTGRQLSEKLPISKFDKIAIAHHANDSVETLFINLLRGTGLRGLTGITKVNGSIIRPLLFATREQIITYAKEHSIKYMSDSSNEQLKYLRNRLRLDILPQMRTLAPSFDRIMQGNIARLEQAQSFIDTQIQRIAAEAIHENIIDLSIVNQQHNRNFVMHELLSPYGFSADVIAEIVRSDGHSGKQFHSPIHTATIDRKRLIIKPIDTHRATAEATISAEDDCIEVVERHTLESLLTPANTAIIDASKIIFPLTVRAWQLGDSFVPLGMRGHKKVSDYLIDTKVPMTDKAAQLVIVNGDQSIIWLVGRRIDERYKITEQTQKAIKITL